jgi:hypothetical protein
MCTALCVPGWLFALLQWPTAAIVVTFVLFTLIAGIAVVARRTSEIQSQGRSHTRGRGAEGFAADGWGSSTALAVLAGAVSVGLAATLEASPALALVIALTMVVCSPPALQLLRELRSPSRTRLEPPGPSTETLAPAAQPEPVVHPSAVAAVTNAELCALWRSSYTALQRASTTAARTRLVANRQVFLDEMERRNPTALTAWLTSGARAASGPDRYLDDGPNRR